LTGKGIFHGNSYIHKFNSNSLDRLVVIPPSGEPPGNNRLTQIKYSYKHSTAMI